MFLDHINKILFDEHYLILTLIGRLAYPLFIYLAVKSYIYYTHDKLNYIIRIMFFALISTPFVMYGFNQPVIPLNILFSILFGLLTIYLYEEKQYIWIGFPVLFSLYSEYSYPTILAFLSMYLFLKQRNIYTFIIVFASFFLLNAYFENYYLVPFFLLVFFDLYFKFDFRSTLNKYFFYLFYPLHIALLGVLK